MVVVQQAGGLLFVLTAVQIRLWASAQSEGMCHRTQLQFQAGQQRETQRRDLLL